MRTRTDWAIAAALSAPYLLGIALSLYGMYGR